MRGETAESIRELFDRALRAGIRAADPEEAIRVSVPPDLGPTRVIALGKAACAMARGAAKALGERLIGGIAVSDHASDLPDGLCLMLGDHPFPGRRSVIAGRALLEEASKPGDLLVLVSGGASALAESPIEGVAVEELAEIQRDLMASGAPISEVNTVRRHLSRIKNGGLAQAAAGNRVITLLAEDVGGGPASVIGSGPTISDGSTGRDALEVLRRTGVTAPAGVLSRLKDSVRPVASSVGEWAVVLGGEQALASVMDEVTRVGLPVDIYSSNLSGSSAESAVGMLSATCPGAVLMAIGETTVVLGPTPGVGGRNQHAALRAAIALNGGPGVFGAIGTDGRDGPTTAAGAIVDGTTVGRMRRAGVEPDAALRACDSHRALLPTGDLLVTGHTGTNVGDIWVSWAGPRLEVATR